MAEYIDRTALLAELALNDYPWTDLDDAYNAIQAMPAADVAPVVHGRWVSLRSELSLFSCSLCEHVLLGVTCHYCPNCGAKMDKDGTQ